MPSDGPAGGQRGHSLVEVMVSIVILSVAIIPMVTMFDTGLSLATRASGLDRARAFAGERLAYAETLDYEQVRDEFPTPGSAPDGGTYQSANLAVPEEAGLPPGATYTVAKEFLAVLSDDPAVSPVTLAGTGSDRGLLRTTVEVRWSDRTYRSSWVVAAGDA